MKIEKVKFFLLTCLFIFITNIVLADSPLTSTPFSEAYEDLQIVSKARLGVMNEVIAEYLHSESNPIDKKAAVINALGWDVDGESNALAYCNIVYNRTIDELDIDAFTGSELFVIGYLSSMDNYQQPKAALPFMKRAKTLLNNSYTMNIIYGLVKAQNAMTTDFCKAWKYVNKVFMNDQLDMDMREDARKIIYDYMVLYKESCK